MGCVIVLGYKNIICELLCSCIFFGKQDWTAGRRQTTSHRAFWRRRKYHPYCISTIEEVEAAQCLVEFIKFAILRLMQLGDLALGEQVGGFKEGGLQRFVNPILQATSERPLDTLEPWEPWRELQKTHGEINAYQLKKVKNGNPFCPIVACLYGLIMPWKMPWTTKKHI